MKLIKRSVTIPTGIMLFGSIYVLFCERAGSAWILTPDCENVMFSDSIIHFYGVYLQLGRWGGNVMVRSHKCLEQN